MNRIYHIMEGAPSEGGFRVHNLVCDLKPDYARGMKLTEKQAEVLTAIRLDPNASVPTIAKFLKVKETSVRSALRGLKRYEVFSRYPLINVSKLGYLEYDITCGLSLSGDDERERFFGYLAASPQVGELIETGGVYHCSFTLLAQSPLEVDEFMQGLGEKFGPVFVNDCIGIGLRYSIFPPKYLSRKGTLKDSVTVSAGPADHSVKRVDVSILKALAEHPEDSFREIARITGLPISTLNDRVKALTANGTLVGYSTGIQESVFGHQGFRIHLATRGLNPSLKAEIFEFAKTHPNVTYLIEWVGEWQYCIGLLVANANDASAIVNQIYDRFGRSLRELVLFPVVRDRQYNCFPINPDSVFD